MDFSFSEEQRSVQSTARKYLAEHYKFELRQKTLAQAPTRESEHWQQFCDLGWVGLAIPPEAGGYGGGLQDILVLAQELGRSLVLEPYLANAILAGTVLSKCANTVSAELLEELMAGTRQFALGYAESGERFEHSHAACTLFKTEAGYELTGHKMLVYNAEHCDDLLVVATFRNDDGLKYYLVRLSPSDAGVEIDSFRTVDGFAAANISFKSVAIPESAVLSDKADRLLPDAIQRGALCICSEAVGIMESLLEKTVDYVKTRKQFGVPLGSFQVIQHKLADMFVQVEQSRSILYRWAIEGKADSQIWHAAKARIAIACRAVGEEAVQLHGGMGISNELDIGHYFKRLSVISMLFGDADYHLGKVSTA